MALFSDVDWIVLLAVAAFLLFGSQGREVVRNLGRLYARAMRFRADMMREITSSTGLPVGAGGTSGTIREALLGSSDLAAPPPAPATSPYLPAMPGLVTQVAPVNIRAVETLAYGAAMGAGVWSVAATSSPGEVVRLQ